MSDPIRRAFRILHEQGIRQLFRKALRRILYVAKRFFLLPYVMLEVRKTRSCHDLHKLIDFAFRDHMGIIYVGQVKSEITALLEISNAMKPRCILEIGTAGGGTLFLFCKVASKDATLISVDLPRGKFGGGYPTQHIPLYKSFASKSQQLNLIRGNSHDAETFERVSFILNERKIDLLFIDGDHTYDGVKKDFDLYASLVGKNGIIAFHDIVIHPAETGCAVHKFWEEVKSKYKHEEIVENPGQNWAGIGILHVGQPVPGQSEYAEPDTANA